MKFGKSATSSILSSAALIVLAGPVSAEQEVWSGIDSEIDSCVTAVAEHANYNDASKVRHAVVDVKERALGYKLIVETSLYNDASDNAIREYAATCIVNGSNAPLEFSISETDNDA